MGPGSEMAGLAAITIAGPGATSGGVTPWSLNASPGAYSLTYPSSAVFYAGPIASNPLATRIQKAGITSTVLSYGVGGGGHWRNDGLLGVSQTGKAVSVLLFTDDSGVDHSAPVDEITYMLAPAQ